MEEDWNRQVCEGMRIFRARWQRGSMNRPSARLASSQYRTYAPDDQLRRTVGLIILPVSLSLFAQSERIGNGGVNAATRRHHLPSIRLGGMNSTRGKLLRCTKRSGFKNAELSICWLEG